MGSKKKKKTNLPNHKKRNDLPARQKAAIITHRQAEKETYIQFMADMIVLTLNDPDVMGKDVFGKKRINKVLEGLSKKYDKYCAALYPGDEADYHQIKLDERLSQIFGDDFDKFGERYYWLKDLT